MKVATASQMRRIDELSQEQFGISGWALMQEAGRAVANLADKTFYPNRVCVVCGKGNNGGDGLVVAHEFHQIGREVSVVCLDDPVAFTGPAAEAWNLLQQTKVPVCSADELEEKIANSDLVIDAILGTGLSGAPREPAASAIRTINKSDKPVVAVDVPSGLRDGLKSNSPTDETIICATVTYSIGLPKTMLLTLPGISYAGHLEVLPINFPHQLLQSDDIELNWATWEEMKDWVPVRPLDSNKGTFGHVGIIGSALSYAGASVLVSRAALRTGCGLATVYTLPSVNAILKTAIPEATSVILDSSFADHFDSSSGEQFAELDRQHTVLCGGPGLGTAPETADFLWCVLRHWKGALVLDADALNLLADGMLGLIGGREHCVITPHPGEMARLLDTTVAEVQADRQKAASGFAQRHGVTVLLKGAGTLVARPDGQCWIIPGAESALAKGGTGDVLTGAIASLIAQGMQPWQGAIVGATAHLEAGMRVAEQRGQRGVLAGEVADEIPLVLDHHLA